MAYYNRKEQIKLTLNQFEKLYANKYNFEVIIVDDCSDEKEKLNDIINNYSFKIKYIELKNKNWINPVVPFNIAINNIDRESNIIIFQNPETFHCEDILNHASNIKFDEYFVYPVYNSPSYEENDKLNKTLRTGDLAYIDHENYIYIIGRKNRFAKISGVRVSLDNIEEILKENNYINAVISDDKTLNIFIEGEIKDKNKKRIKEILKKRTTLSPISFKISFIKNLPRNDNGKIDYKQLKK